MIGRATAAALALALVAGCATLDPPPPGGLLQGEAARAAEAAQLAREAALGLAGGDCAAPGWDLQGRAALSNGREGGSGRIEWSQGAGRTVVTLAAPVTRQGWTLTVDPAGARLDGVPGGPLRDPDAAALLRGATGWDIPVAALGCWLRGARAGHAAGAARFAYGLDGLPRRLEQDGWTIDFPAWGREPGGPALPARVEARRGEHHVRLVVDRWSLE